MDSLAPSDQAETTEAGPSEEPASYKDAQVWRNLEAETGFASYTDYLDYYKDVRPNFQDKLKQLRNLPKDHVEANRRPSSDPRKSFAIYDLSMQEDSQTRLSLRCYRDSPTELIQALREARQPSGSICVQLVLWNTYRQTLSHEMADALVLGLKLDVEFLVDLIAFLLLEQQYHTRNAAETRKGFRASHNGSVRGTATLATISQSFMPDPTNVIPFLFVASALDDYLDHDEWVILARSVRKMPPFCRTPSARLMTADSTYAKLVKHFIAQSRDATPSKIFVLLAAISPLLYVEAYRVRNAYDQSRNKYTDKRQPQQALDIMRRNLRRLSEETEDLVGQVFRYLTFEAHSDCLKEPSWLSIKADIMSLIHDARRLETEVRDYLQLQVGNLALEESRKSIELSNLQIREAKSGKLAKGSRGATLILFSNNMYVFKKYQKTASTESVPVTILAFIYVPLNLATSLFGMNIQQLNGNGQNLWVFFTTAIAALLLTGGSLFLSKHFATHEAVTWYKERLEASTRYKERAAAERANEEIVESQEYGFLLRIAMLVWLMRKGHKAWMWKSGAWIGITINSKASGIRSDGMETDSACSYVMAYSQPDYYEEYRFPNHPNNIYFTTWSPLSQ